MQHTHTLSTDTVRRFAQLLCELSATDHSFSMAQAGKIQDIAYRMEAVARIADGCIACGGTDTFPCPSCIKHQSVLDRSQGDNEHVIISADRPVEYGTLDGDTIKVRS